MARAGLVALRGAYAAVPPRLRPMAFVGLGLGMGWVQAGGLGAYAHMKAIQSKAGGEEGPRIDKNEDDFIIVRTVKGEVCPPGSPSSLSLRGAGLNIHHTRPSSQSSAAPQVLPSQLDEMVRVAGEHDVVLAGEASDPSSLGFFYCSPAAKKRQH